MSDDTNDEEPMSERAAFFLRAMPVHEYLLTQDMHGKPIGIPEEHGEYYGVDVWSVVYTTDHGYYKIWVAPTQEAWAWANDGTHPVRLTGATAFAYPEEFGRWVFGSMLVNAVEEAQEKEDAGQMPFGDQGPVKSA